MAQISEEGIRSEINSNVFAPVYLFFGEDAYLKKHYADSLAKKICGDDSFFDFQKFTRDCQMQDVFDAVNQLPMMSQVKCVLLDDYDYIHADKSESAKLTELILDIPDTCVLIIKFDAVEFDPKYNASAKKIEAAVNKAGGKTVLLNHRSESSLAAMLSRGAKKRGLTLPDSVARYMISVAGDDINTLSNELDKICLNLREGDITKDNIDNLCSKTVEASVYDYVKEIFSLNITSALSLLDGMFYMHIDPIIIVYTVSGAYVDIFRMMSAESGDIKTSEVMSDFSYKYAFLLDRARANAKRFDSSKISSSLNVILETDEALKNSTADPRILLEEMTVKLGYILSSGGDAV